MATISYAGSVMPPAPEAPHAHIFVALSCAGRTPGATRSSLHGIDEVRIGRGAVRSTLRSIDDGARVLRVHLPDGRVSTSHARIVRDAEGWVLEDAGSKNGTFVGEARVERARLVDGAILSVGETVLVFRAELPTPPNTPSDVDVDAGGPFVTLVPGLARQLDELVLAASSSVPILLESETGTGKEVLARAIHGLARPRGPFVAVNCGALPDTLAESVLFGHRRGAFSGASGDSDGLLRSADGGTLLLDEVGEMPLALQPALLRALESGEVLPVGATHTSRTTARFIGATNVSLEARIAAGSFREDLYGRLAGFVFRMPALRDRREDIGLLATALLERIAAERGAPASLTIAAARLLFAHDWPRNVRELEKALARAAALAGPGAIEPLHLPPEVREPRAKRPAVPSAAPAGQHDERARLVALLVEKRGNLAAVAAAMQTSRSQVHRWLRRFAIDPDTYRR